MGDVDPTLSRRWTELGLDRPDLGLAPDQTITARTLAAPPPVAPAPSVDPRELPHISVGEGGVRPAETPSLPRADLSLVASLGEGGMGHVHLAHQHSLDRDVAIKSLKDGSPGDAMVSLLHEARLTGTLEHPGVIPVHALGVDDAGRPLLVMKRVEGVDWRTLLTDPAHPAWEFRGGAAGDRLAQNLEILAHVSQTAEFAHSRGVVHRDIKPENVMIGRFGEVLLVDWGVAARLKDPPSGLVIGTPMFMAPEMARGDAVDARTDVYLLGATLHEVLTGRPRHDGETLFAILRAAVLSQPFAYGPEVPSPLADLCNRATAADPAVRPQTAEKFRQELLDFLRFRGALALSEAASERLAALDGLLAEVPAGEPPRDLSSAYRLLTEARFGFAQSLREHPGNLPAQRGVQASVAAQIDLELRQQHAETARALLRELPEPDPILADRVRAAEGLAADRARAAARLRAMARDHDASVGRRSRFLLLGVLAACLAVISAVIALGVAGPYTPDHAFWTALLVGGGVGAGIYVFRRTALANAFSRRLAAILVAAIGAQIGNRGMGRFLDHEIADILWRDLLISGCFAAAAAIALLPSLGWAVVPLALGVVVMPFAPAHALTVYGVSLVCCVVLLARDVVRAPRQPPPG